MCSAIVVEVFIVLFHKIMGIRPRDAQSPQRPITPEPPHSKHLFGLGMWQKLQDFFHKDDHLEVTTPDSDSLSWPNQPPPPSRRDWPGRVGIGLPRQTTFRRQNSEKRDRLLPVLPGPEERRAFSHSRQASVVAPRARANSTPATYAPARISAPTLVVVTNRVDGTDQNLDFFPTSDEIDVPAIVSRELDDSNNRPPRPSSPTSSLGSHDARRPMGDENAQINAELDNTWILNLSMHFRDKSEREKFFITYAEAPNKWRRVTVSCDYRNAERGSLEMDLKELQFPRDKSLQIYESIRESLPEIQFYDTVTNLKLDTSAGRLHVHVTEDQNEIIPYPPRSTVDHLLEDNKYQPQQICESDLIFESHLSGFVYKVNHHGKTYIKKEIPGPDTVNEFLYEINALHELHESIHVIRLEAIVLDDTSQLVKGLLISYAEKGAVVDLLYDFKGRIPLDERLQWARDAVFGLSEIHGHGYVQGDFTLSNIVVDAEGKSKIIDINRRGCPVGWEPPELVSKIASHQPISMYIGEKTDIYQLGMTLWGLAADDDEPERHGPPLRAADLPEEVPAWYREIVDICLEPERPDRLSAKELAYKFPPLRDSSQQALPASPPFSAARTQERYIDPSQAVERDDIEKFNRQIEEDELYSPQSSKFDDTFTYPRSSNYDRGSDISAFERPRGRRPPANFEHLDQQERQHWSPEEIVTSSADGSEPQILSISPDRENEYQKIDLDGQPFLIPRDSFSDEDLRILERPARAEEVTEADRSTPTITTERTIPSGSGSHILKRPPILSRTSGTSSSTPRNSQLILPDVAIDEEAITEEAKVEHLPGLPEHSVSSRDRLGQSIDSGIQHEPDSVSPLPSPSLAYADSGFHEPTSFSEEAAASVDAFSSRSELSALARSTHPDEMEPDLDAMSSVQEASQKPEVTTSSKLPSEEALDQHPQPTYPNAEAPREHDAGKSESILQGEEHVLEVTNQCKERGHQEAYVVDAPSGGIT